MVGQSSGKNAPKLWEPKGSLPSDHQLPKSGFLWLALDSCGCNRSFVKAVCSVFYPRPRTLSSTAGQVCVEGIRILWGKMPKVHKTGDAYCSTDIC